MSAVRFRPLALPGEVCQPTLAVRKQQFAKLDDVNAFLGIRTRRVRELELPMAADAHKTIAYPLGIGRHFM